MSELKPCPFCGGEAQCITEYCKEVELLVSKVNCTRCGIKTPYQHYANEAIDLWNRRVSDDT